MNAQIAMRTTVWVRVGSDPSDAVGDGPPYPSDVLPARRGGLIDMSVRMAGRAVLAILMWLLVAAPVARADDATGGADPTLWRQHPSGLEWRDTQVGHGEEATRGARVEVHYTGRLTDGRIFDDSRQRGEPLVFRVGAGHVIQGWDIGVQGMREGGRRELLIPPELGYGQRAAGPIPPGSTLHFDIELVRVVEAAPPLTPGPAEVDGAKMVSRRSGLQWADLRRGTGHKPKKGHRVCVAYTAWADGELVDDTRSRGRCWWFRFGHDVVLEPLAEGIASMREGGIRQLHVPAGAAVGPGPNGPIAADGPVILEVELVEATR